MCLGGQAVVCLLLGEEGRTCGALLPKFEMFWGRWVSSSRRFEWLLWLYIKRLRSRITFKMKASLFRNVGNCFSCNHTSRPRISEFPGHSLKGCRSTCTCRLTHWGGGGSLTSVVLILGLKRTGWPVFRSAASGRFYSDVRLKCCTSHFVRSGRDSINK